MKKWLVGSLTAAVVSASVVAIVSASSSGDGTSAFVEVFDGMQEDLDLEGLTELAELIVVGEVQGTATRRVEDPAAINAGRPDELVSQVPYAAVIHEEALVSVHQVLKGDAAAEVRVPFSVEIFADHEESKPIVHDDRHHKFELAVGQTYLLFLDRSDELLWQGRWLHMGAQGTFVIVNGSATWMKDQSVRASEDIIGQVHGLLVENENPEQ